MSPRPHFPPLLAIPLLVACACVVLPARQASAALIGYWSFNGCTLTDASGQAQDLAAFGGPTCVAGQSGEAWNLNGTDQYLGGTSSPAYVPTTSAWSVAAWVRCSTGSGFESVVSWYRCGANPNCGNGDAACYILGILNGDPYWDVRDDAGNDYGLTLSNDPVLDGKWHLLVGTMNPVPGRVHFYLDGALADSAAGPLGTLSSGGFGIPLQVGRLFRNGWASPAYYFGGDVDEVRIYNEELTAAAVAQLYGQTVGIADRADHGLQLRLSGSARNPALAAHLEVAFTLPSAAPARLRLLDVKGRVRAAREVGSLGEGSHRVVLTEGRQVSAGVYWIELEQTGRVRAQRVALLN